MPRIDVPAIAHSADIHRSSNTCHRPWRRGLIASALLALVVAATPLGAQTAGTTPGGVAVAGADAQQAGGDNIVVTADNRDNTQLGSFEEIGDPYLAFGKRVVRSTGVDAARFTFVAPIAKAGWYRVYLWVPVRPLGGPAVDVRVLHAGGSSGRNVDQSTLGGQWRFLGIYRFAAGSAPRIELASGSKQSLVADAARFQYVGETEPPLRITTGELAIAQRGVAYDEVLEAEAGDGSYRWRAVSALPAGLTLDVSGRITGRPLQAGARNVTLEVSDGSGHIARQVFRLEIAIGSSEPQGAASAASAVARAQGATGAVPEATNTVAGAQDSASAASSESVGIAAAEASTSPSIAAATAVVSASLAPSGDVRNLLSIIRAAPAGSWVKGNLNKYADVWPAAELRPLYYSGVPTPEKIILAWSSFAWDSNRARMWLYGGGHANYFGNDVYTWNASTMLWERASYSSEIVQDALGTWIAIDGVDAAPASAHTYDNNIFLPIIDRFLTFGGGVQDGSGNYRRMATASTTRRTGPYLFDPNRADGNKVGGTTGSHVKRVASHPEIVGGNMWQNRDLPLNLPNAGDLPASHISGCTAYAEEAGKDVVYLAGRPGSSTQLTLFRYIINSVSNPKTDTLTKVGRYAVGTSLQTACAYDPVTKFFVRTGSTTVPFTYWNLNNASATNPDIKITVQDPGNTFLPLLSAGTLSPSSCGLDFDGVRRKFMLWCGDDRVWSLTAPTGGAGWVIRKETASAGAAGRPTLGPGTGVLGKWKYASNLDAYIGLQDIVQGNVWIYKPAGWVDPDGVSSGANLPPTVSLTAPAQGATFTAGTSIALSATASDLDGQVARVQFFRGTTLIGQDTTSPYAFTWASVPAGNYTLTAVATDNTGTSTTSSPVAITVGSGGTPTGGSTSRVLQDGTSSYTGTRDTYLSKVYPVYSFGKATTLNSTPADASPLVRFAIFQSEGGPVPDGSTITSATLSLYKYTSYDYIYRAHRILSPWEELQSSWNNRLTGAAWRSPGAGGAGTDYAASADGQAAVGWNPQWLDIDVTAGVRAMSAGTANYGWKLVPVSGNANLKRFYSREFGTTSLRPKLTITYTAP